MQQLSDSDLFELSQRKVRIRGSPNCSQFFVGGVWGVIHHGMRSEIKVLDGILDIT